MLPSPADRRSITIGSILCETDVTRLRLLPDMGTMALMLETLDPTGTWLPMATSLTAPTLQVGASPDTAHPVNFYSWAPLHEDGITIGVCLTGTAGPWKLTYAITLGPWGTFSQHVLTLTSPTPAPVALHQRWQIPGLPAPLDVHWPPTPQQGIALTGQPGLLAQHAHYFAGLVPDLEDSDAEYLRVQCVAAPDAPVTFDIQLTSPQPARSFRLAYALVLDARALPSRGYQQLIRWAGTADVLRIGVSPPAPTTRALPSFPLSATDLDPTWVPFGREGSPAALAQGIWTTFQAAHTDEWAGFDAGLCWLDRLCAQQVIVEVPGGPPLGTFTGADAGWVEVRVWLPVLLWGAFTLTGQDEYLYRCRVALAALPPSLCDVALANLQAHSEKWVYPL